MLTRQLQNSLTISMQILAEALEKEKRVQNFSHLGIIYTETSRWVYRNIAIKSWGQAHARPQHNMIINYPKDSSSFE